MDDIKIAADTLTAIVKCVTAIITLIILIKSNR